MQRPRRGGCGEAEQAEACTFLGTLRLTGLPPGPRGMVKIALTFELGAECLLTVTAREMNTGRSVQAVLSTRDGQETMIRKLGEPATTGSIEYAAEHLNVPLIVVLGHHKCGAVKATAEATGPVEGNIGAIVKELQPAVEAAKAAPGKRGLVDDAVYANAELVAKQLLTESPVLTHLAHAGKIKIVTAIYDLDTGKVEWGDAAPAAEKGKHEGHDKH